MTTQLLNAREKDCFEVPAAPIRPLLRLYAATLYEHVETSHFRNPRVGRSGLRQLARLYAQRYAQGTEADTDSAGRVLQRILNKRTKSITSITADRWSCLIGLHPALIWPEEWREGRGDEEAA